jgi:hypothetical protein
MGRRPCLFKPAKPDRLSQRLEGLDGEHHTYNHAANPA